MGSDRSSRKHAKLPTLLLTLRGFVYKHWLGGLSFLFGLGRFLLASLRSTVL